MTEDAVRATAVIDAAPDAIFAILADPATHAAIDGTGWVCDTLDPSPLIAVGQIFGMSMYHPNHPDGHYEMHNLVETYDRPHAISWKPGYDAGDGTLGFGGWTWRYDLMPTGAASTTVTLTYDWAAVPDLVRQRFVQQGAGFPPFPPEHLDNSLAHLAELVASARLGHQLGQ